MTECRITVIQGERHVTRDPAVVLCTVLGSCVAACLRDPEEGIGGMNHFLLPGRSPGGDAAIRHGVHAMELLVNDLLAQGARREKLRAKLFGGGRMMRGLFDIGAVNAAFAERFLREENIVLLGGSLGGTRGRRLQFWPGSGRARQMLMAEHDPNAFDDERRRRAKATSVPVAGALELF